jgi:hypothetical protein
MLAAFRPPGQGRIVPAMCIRIRPLRSAGAAGAKLRIHGTARAEAA